VNALFLLDAKGKVILSRQYRGYVTNAVVSRFVAQLLEEEEVNLKVSRAKRNFGEKEKKKTFLLSRLFADGHWRSPSWRTRASRISTSSTTICFFWL